MNVEANPPKEILEATGYEYTNNVPGTIYICPEYFFWEPKGRKAIGFAIVRREENAGRSVLTNEGWVRIDDELVGSRILWLSQHECRELRNFLNGVIATEGFYYDGITKSHLA